MNFVDPIDAEASKTTVVVVRKYSCCDCCARSRSTWNLHQRTRNKDCGWVRSTGVDSGIVVVIVVVVNAPGCGLVDRHSNGCCNCCGCCNCGATNDRQGGAMGSAACQRGDWSMAFRDHPKWRIENWLDCHSNFPPKHLRRCWWSSSCSSGPWWYSAVAIDPNEWDDTDTEPVKEPDKLDPMVATTTNRYAIGPPFLV